VREKFQSPGSTSRKSVRPAGTVPKIRSTPVGWGSGRNLIDDGGSLRKCGQHQPLDRQSERFVREGVDISLSPTLGPI